MYIGLLTYVLGHNMMLCLSPAPFLDLDCQSPTPVAFSHPCSALPTPSTLPLVVPMGRLRLSHHHPRTVLWSTWLECLLQLALTAWWQRSATITWCKKNLVSILVTIHLPSNKDQVRCVSHYCICSGAEITWDRLMNAMAVTNDCSYARVPAWTLKSTRTNTWEHSSAMPEITQASSSRKTVV